MKNLILSAVLSCFIFSISLAQSIPEIDSKKIIEKGVELHDEEKYVEAIAEFKKVNKNDSNFVLACLEIVNSYFATGQDSLIPALCDLASTLPTSYAPQILLYKANAFDNLKNTEEAIKLYKDGIKKYPLNHSFYYELGLHKMREEKYKEAHEYFIEAIKCNPYYAQSHDRMAQLALKQGKLIPAMLSWQFYLLLNSSSSRARDIIIELEKIAKNEVDLSSTVKIEGLSDQDDFSEVEALVKSKVALGNKYKSQIKLNYNITKQLQLIFEKLSYEKSDKGFYMNFYAPFFIDLQKNELFEPYTYSILSGVNNDEVNSWVKKHKEELNKFYKVAGSYISDNYLTHETLINGKLIMAHRWYQNQKISSVGNENADGGNIGYWNYYFPNGILMSEGLYNDVTHKREGDWKFYFETGPLKAIESYIDGNVEGKSDDYYQNGNIKTHKNFKNGELDGLQTLYFATSGIATTYDYKAGKQDGREISYYQNGKKKYDLNVVNEKYEGPFIQYYNNGHIMERTSFLNGERNGKHEYFFKYPENTIEVEATYSNGKYVGEYKSFFRNGKMKTAGTYSKLSEKEGIWKTYFDNGKLASEENFIAGKFDGTSKYFDEEGRLTDEYIYKKDNLQEYKAYASDGKIVYQNKKEGKNNYDANIYYPNGNKRREGKVLAGKLTDTWKDYNINGYLKEVVTYKEGNKNGTSITYHDNGKVDVETVYLNGESDGYFKSYFTNSRIKREGIYINNNETGEWKNYYGNGNIYSKIFYNNGTQQGWQEYYAVDGKLTYEEFFTLGYVSKRILYDTLEKVDTEILFEKGSGDLISKYKNGKTKVKYTYLNNQLQGPYNYYYPDGTLLSSKTFQDDEENGDHKYYFYTGKLNSVLPYLNGMKHGRRLEYYEDGSLLSDINYDYNKRDGKSIYYHPNKKVEREYIYKDDLVHGKSAFYDETGELIIERTFVKGALTTYNYFDKDGTMLPPIALINETGPVKAYYKSGILSIEYALKNGVVEGKRTVYNSNGKVMEEENYVGGDRTGVAKEYYFSGKLKTEGNYNGDEKDGNFITYFENGKMKSQEMYVFGHKHGLCIYYDATGKRLKTLVYYDDKVIDEK